MQPAGCVGVDASMMIGWSVVFLAAKEGGHSVEGTSYKDDRYVSLLALDQYEREVRYLRLADDTVTDEEKLKLLRRVVRGNAERLKEYPNQWYLSLARHARDELVALCQPLILGIAYKVIRRAPRGASVDVLDLVSEGNVSLLHLLDEKLPEDVTVHAFYGLASKYVYFAMVGAARRSGQLGEHSYQVVAQSSKLAFARDRLLSQLRREPSYQELAREMGVSVERVCELVEARSLHRQRSMEVLVEEFEGEDRDFAALFGQFVETDQVCQQEQEEALQKAVDEVLTDRQRQVIRLRFGIGEAAHTQNEAAQVLGYVQRGMGVGNVGMAERQALKRLRRVFKDGKMTPEQVELWSRKQRQEGYYTAPEAARLLGMRVLEVRNWLNAGRLPGEYMPDVRVGKRQGVWCIPKEAVDMLAMGVMS
jgi:DNA-directed RNA polymerase specialized sigma subunit